MSWEKIVLFGVIAYFAYQYYQQQQAQAGAYQFAASTGALGLSII